MRIVKGYKENQRLAFSDKGMISILKPEVFTMNMYEIYSLDGNLFEDIERFDTEKEALDRCEYLLNKNVEDNDE